MKGLNEKEKKRFDEMRKLVSDETDKEVYERMIRNKDKRLS